MEIKISDLKSLFKENSLSNQFVVGSAEHDFNFEGISSKTLYPNSKIVSLNHI